MGKSFTKVRKNANIRKRYNQVSHLTKDTTWESNKSTININKSQDVSLFPAGDHKATMNRRESMINTKYPKLHAAQQQLLRPLNNLVNGSFRNRENLQYKKAADLVLLSLEINK